MVSRTRIGTAVVFVVAILATAAVTASASSEGYADVKGHVATTANADCEWAHATAQEGTMPPAPDEPRIDSTATLDYYGGSPCSNTNAQALPGTLAVWQNLQYLTPSNTFAWCNLGPPITNPTMSHSVSTGFGWANPPCGNTWYQQQTWSRWWNGVQWDGAYLLNAWQSVYTP